MKLKSDKDSLKKLKKLLSMFMNLSRPQQLAFLSSIDKEINKYDK